MTFPRCRTWLFPFVSLVFIGIVTTPAPARDLSPQKPEPSSPPPLVQDQPGSPARGAVSRDGVEDPLHRALKNHQDKSTQEKESKYYREWEKDVRPIITDEELAAFRKLGTDLERDKFIEWFWQQRDPTPDTEENEYRDEFYRRKAYANEHFSAGMPGEQTDRGLMYIRHGPPDSIETHPMGGPYLRPAEQGGGTTTTFPFEIWRYRRLDGIGQEVEIEFVDQCGCGEYRKTLNYSDKDVMAHVPNAGSTDSEVFGRSNKAARLTDPQGIGQSLFGPNNEGKFFERMEQAVALDRPPALRLLDPNVTSIIRANLLKFDVRVDFLKGSADTVLMPVTLQVPNRELTFVGKDGVQRGLVNIFGRMSTISGKTVQTFEDTVRLDVPAALLDRAMNNVALYWKVLPMHPGRYRLDIVVKDVNGDKLGTFTQGIQVPTFAEDKLSSSSLILADVLEPVAASEVGSGDFVLGPIKVRPKVQSAGKPVAFRQDQKINLWMQVYHLALEEKTQKPAASIEYSVVNMATNQTAIEITKSAEQTGSVGDQLTLREKLPVASLAPGEYQLTVKVTDALQGQSVASVARFRVE